MAVERRRIEVADAGRKRSRKSAACVLIAHFGIEAAERNAAQIRESTGQYRCEGRVAAASWRAPYHGSSSVPGHGSLLQFIRMRRLHRDAAG